MSKLCKIGLHRWDYRENAYSPGGIFETEYETAGYARMCGRCGKQEKTGLAYIPKHWKKIQERIRKV